MFTPGGARSTLFALGRQDPCGGAAPFPTSGKTEVMELQKSSSAEPDGALPNSLNLNFIEGLYAQYLRDAGSVSADWRRYFRQLANGGHGPLRLGPSFQP